MTNYLNSACDCEKNLTDGEHEHLMVKFTETGQRERICLECWNREDFMNRHEFQILEMAL